MLNVNQLCIFEKLISLSSIISNNELCLNNKNIALDFTSLLFITIAQFLTAFKKWTVSSLKADFKPGQRIKNTTYG